MSNKINMEQVLAALANDSTPEEAFATGLQDGTEKVASSSKQEMETPETLEAYTGNGYSDSDLAKVAEADDQGRIMARAFFDELNKMAVAPIANYPADPGAIPMNGAVEVGRGEPAQPHGEKSMQVNSILNSLVAANKVGAPEIAMPAGPQPGQKADLQTGNQPLAADLAKAQERAMVPGMEVEKQSGVKIINNLYAKYFGEEQ